MNSVVRVRDHPIDFSVDAQHPVRDHTIDFSLVPDTHSCVVCLSSFCLRACLLLPVLGWPHGDTRCVLDVATTELVYSSGARQG